MNLFLYGNSFMSTDAQMTGLCGHRHNVISEDETLRDFKAERADTLDRRDQDPRHRALDKEAAWYASDDYAELRRLERIEQAKRDEERALDERFERVDFRALFSDVSYAYYRWAEDWADGRARWYDTTDLFLPSAHGRMEEAVASGLHALFLIAENNLFGEDASRQARELIAQLDPWKMVAALADDLA
jgi:hypothetical protein